MRLSGYVANLELIRTICVLKMRLMCVILICERGI